MDVTYHDAVNLGNPDEYTIQQFANVIRELIDAKLELRYEDDREDDPKQRKPDNSTAKHLLDWQPTTTLEEGLEKTIAYFKSIQAETV